MTMKMRSRSSNSTLLFTLDPTVQLRKFGESPLTGQYNDSYWTVSLKMRSIKSLLPCPIIHLRKSGIILPTSSRKTLFWKQLHMEVML